MHGHASDHAGDPGDPIPGSRYVREFCSHCGEPMRVPPGRVGKVNYCTDCDGPPPPAHTRLVARQRATLGRTTGG